MSESHTEPRTQPQPVTTRLGVHDVRRVGYGAMQLAAAGHDAAVAVLARAIELGVDHIDTAQFYGAGRVNELIHDALHPYPDDLAIATKVGAVRVEGAPGNGLVAAQRPEQLRAQVEENLAALGAERLAVVNLRRLDTPPGIVAEGDQLVDLDSQLAELAALRDEGKIESIGLSGAADDKVRQALPVGLACVQNLYNLLERDEESLLHLCAQHGVAWVPFFPLGSAMIDRARVTDQPAVRAVAQRLDATPAQVGLAWLLGHDPHVLLIPGTTDPMHLQQNVAAGRLVLDARTTAELDALAAPAAPAG